MRVNVLYLLFKNHKSLSNENLILEKAGNLFLLNIEMKTYKQAYLNITYMYFTLAHSEHLKSLKKEQSPRYKVK